MENPCSIFVGSLSPDTTSEMLDDYFKRFGPIESAVVLQAKDQVTNETRSREFGFVNFTSPESRSNALQPKNGPHFIDNKQVECKAAIRKGDQKSDMGGQRQGGGGGRFDQSLYDNQRKVFVGGISNGTSDDDIKIALSSFGTVETVEQKFDKVSQRMRGFGFVEFSTAKEAFEAVRAQFVPINGKTVEIKIAENRQAVQYAPSAGGFSAGSFGNNMSMYNPALGFGGYSPYTSNTGSSYGSGAAAGYMSSNPSFGGNQAYGSNSQYQNYTSKDGGNPYGGGNAYNTSTGFSGASASSYGGGSGSTYAGGSGYGRGAYHPYGQ